MSCPHNLYRDQEAYYGFLATSLELLFKLVEFRATSRDAVPMMEVIGSTGILFFRSEMTYSVLVVILFESIL